MGYAVGKLAQCLGIPYVQPIWEYTIINLVVDFRFGEGIDRRSKWDDLNGIFQNAVKQGYQSQERATPTEPEVTKGTTVARRIKEEQSSDSERLEHRGAGKIPNDDLSTDDEIPICERMPDIWKYADTRDFEVSASGGAVTQEGHLNNVNAFRDLEILDNPDGGRHNQLTPNDRSSRQDIVPEESSDIGAVRHASPLNKFQIHNTINGRYAIRPRMVDTSDIQPSRQLSPSDQQGNDQTKRGGTLYKYSWTGM